MPPRSAHGRIAHCATTGCGYPCCNFSQGNFIVLYPGEVTSAVAAGQSLVHLEIRPAAEGGHRALCKAESCASCDGGYKPLDCASYPLFPGVSATGEVELQLFGRKCPLQLSALVSHAAWVLAEWRRLAQTSQTVRHWLAKVRLVGYHSFLKPPTPERR